ncbi:MAG: alkaline phosphatase family protein, partial [Chloroflexi bacterium]|nr:alkaline phosphatase family protein [Chloroflexota bacterium]
MKFLKTYIPVSIIPLTLILWGLFGATQLAAFSFKAFIDYQTPYADAAAPGSAAAPLTPRVIIVVADGLRLDSSQQMSNLNALRAKGADRPMRVGLPSLSLPGWTVIGTGAWQEQHGQTTNFDARPSPLDSIFLAARRGGLSTALTGTPGWEALFKDQIDTILIEPDPDDAHHRLEAVRQQDDAIEADALKMLKEKEPNLLLVHFTAPDDASHGFGALSPQNARAVADVDERLGRLLSAVDLNSTTVFFTADHGHLDGGGHGGAEDVVMMVPFVAAGRGILPGRYATAMQADIAPTTAILLGTSIPAHNQGDVLFDMLDLSASAAAERAVIWARQIAARYGQMAKVIGFPPVEHKQLADAEAALAAGNDEAVVIAAQADVATTREAHLAFREGRLQTERLTRTPAFLLLLLPLALYARLMFLMGWEFKRPLAGAVAYFAVYTALFFGRGYGFSLSVFNEDEQIRAFFASRTVDAIFALACGALIVGLLSSRHERTAIVVNTINAAFCTAALIWVQVCGFYWLYDFNWPWYLPDQALGFKYYLDVVQTGAFMVKDPPIPTIVLLP